MVGTAMTGPSERRLLQLVVLRLALDQAQPPTVVGDDNGDVVRVVEETAAVRSNVASSKFHLRRIGLPDEPC